MEKCSSKYILSLAAAFILGALCVFLPCLTCGTLNRKFETLELAKNLHGKVNTYGTFAKYNNTIILREEESLENQIYKSNTKYIIRHDFNLKGKKLELPENVTLEFDGGCINNGSIIFNQTHIIRPCFSSVRFFGDIAEETFNIIDYGAIPGTDMDCSVVINDLIRLNNYSNSSRNAKKLIVPNGTFNISQPIVLFAGWEAPVTIEGNGNTSTICQNADNDYIFKVYESQNIKNLRLIYKNRQGLSNPRSVAIACQRAIFCNFENLTISKAYDAVGYINKADAKKENLTGLNQQVYVSCNFRNIRVYEFSNYAFDFKKEISGGDSGSVFDNIYISSQDWLSSKSDNKAQGAVRGESTMAVFTQLNIEGNTYMKPLISMSGMCRINITSLHIEWLRNIPTIIFVKDQSFAQVEMLDVQNCTFNVNYYAFCLENNGNINNQSFMIREDCRVINSNNKCSISRNNSSSRCKVNTIIDTPSIFRLQ